MDRPAQRPRFELAVALSPEEVARRLEDALRAGGACVGSVRSNHAWIHVRDEERHVWSPTLDLEYAPSDDGGTLLRGRFAPHPSIWTLFVFTYAVLGLLSVLAAMGGLAQLTMGDPPWAFLGTAVGCALIGFVYGAAFIGQGLGADEMTRMRLFLDRTIGPGEEPGPATAGSA